MSIHYYFVTCDRLLFLKATSVGLGAWLHTLVAEYLRTLISWSVRPRWRCGQAQRRAMLQAIGDTWRGRWGKQHLTVQRMVKGWPVYESLVLVVLVSLSTGQWLPDQDL